MSQIIITESQLTRLKSNLNEDQLNEAWYNTVMDIVGLADPTGVVDIVNGISYFTQGETLFGILSIVAAIPYAGDVVAKPVMGAMKLGSASTKTLEAALKAVSRFPPGSPEYKAALQSLDTLANSTGVVGKFLQSASSWAPKINRALDGIPLGPFKGMKNTLMDYFTLLGRAGSKSKGLQNRVKVALAAPTPANLQRNIPVIQNYLKTSKIFDPAALSKPGFMSQVFFGGIPRIFRSPEGRRLKILMQSTKWWLGFLDYIGLGNFVGPEEVIAQMGDPEFQRRLEQYQNTPEARRYFEEDFGQGQPVDQTQTQPSQDQSSSQSSTEMDPFAKFLRNLFMGQINPLPV
jgi:hypothetical protein